MQLGSLAGVESHAACKPQATGEERDTVSNHDFNRVLAVISGKGGVLKTEIATNVAGVLAGDGLRTLLINWDTLSTADLNLGIRDDPRNDYGRGVVNSVFVNADLPIVRDVRPNLDYLYGGRGLSILEQMAISPTPDHLPEGSVQAAFTDRLARVAGDYDMVIFDCPPKSPGLHSIVLHVARWVIVPTGSDNGSLEGLIEIGPAIKKARENNPDLDYLGIVITAHDPKATRILRHVRETLDQSVGDKVPLLDTFIRLAYKAGVDARNHGLLAHEMVREIPAAKAARFKALRAAKKAGTPLDSDDLPEAISQTTVDLAGDYRSLATEICDRITAEELQVSR